MSSCPHLASVKHETVGQWEKRERERKEEKESDSSPVYYSLQKCVQTQTSEEQNGALCAKRASCFFQNLSQTKQSSKIICYQLQT